MTLHYLRCTTWGINSILWITVFWDNVVYIQQWACPGSLDKCQAVSQHSRPDGLETFNGTFYLLPSFHFRSLWCHENILCYPKPGGILAHAQAVDTRRLSEVGCAAWDRGVKFVGKITKISVKFKVEGQHEGRYSATYGGYLYREPGKFLILTMYHLNKLNTTPLLSRSKVVYWLLLSQHFSVTVFRHAHIQLLLLCR